MKYYKIFWSKSLDHFNLVDSVTYKLFFKKMKTQSNDLTCTIQIKYLKTIEFDKVERDVITEFLRE